MIVTFKAVYFLVPENFDGIYQGAFHCLGLVLDVNDFEQILVAPVKLPMDDKEEGLGICCLSAPAYVNSIEAFQAIASMGENILATPIVKVDRVISENLLLQLPLRGGTMDFDLSISNFSATIRAGDFLVNVTITPAGFVRLVARC